MHPPSCAFDHLTWLRTISSRKIWARQDQLFRNRKSPAQAQLE
jgi:hypothetical protein